MLNDETLDASYGIGANGMLPWYTLIGRDMTIRYSGGSPPTTGTLDEALLEEWPDVDRPENPEGEAAEAPADDDDDEGAEPRMDNPFAMDPAVEWEAANACNVGGSSTAPWAALLLIPLFLLRRR